MLFLIAGFATYYVIWRIEKVRNPKVGFWSTPAAMGIMWAVFAVAAVGMGTKMGYDALKEDMRGGLFAPQLRGAMAISGVDERDQALGKVALQAASANDVKAVKRALDEIRGGDLHDRIAADCALALVQLGRSADAGSIAGMIRTTSLRDATLAKVAMTTTTNALPTMKAIESPGAR
jgi:hypothetical protein